MSRPTKFSDDELLEAALKLFAEGGPAAVTIAAIVTATGAPVGSIYHRFASRDLLLARLWIRTVKRFQAGLLVALGDEDLAQAALSAAQHVVSWCRENLDEARLLTLYRHQDLAAQWPEELQPELANLNKGVEAALKRHADRHFGPDDPDGPRRLSFVIADVPYAAVRRHLLAGEPPPVVVDHLVATVCRKLLIDP
ncbi:MAG: TetR/AcrR family transcriptional regulator [Actinomycetota bacterium]